MAISYVGTDSDDNGTATTAIIVPVPAGVADGDVLVALVAMIGQPSITAVPSGWTLLGQQDSGSNLRTAAYWKLASGESGSWTWSLGASFKNFGVVSAYRGCDPADPIAAYAPNSGNGGSSMASASVTVPGAGWLWTGVGARHANVSAVNTWTASGGTERYDFGSNSGSQDCTGAVYDPGSDMSAGSATRTHTPTLTIGLWATHAVALRSASVAPPTLSGWVVGVPI